MSKKSDMAINADNFSLSDNSFEFDKPTLAPAPKADSPDGGFFSSPEFFSQLGSMGQDLFERQTQNQLAQTALATAPFAPKSSQMLLAQASSGLGKGFDGVGATLKSKAIRDLRLREKREAKQREMLAERNDAKKEKDRVDLKKALRKNKGIDKDLEDLNKAYDGQG